MKIANLATVLRHGCSRVLNTFPRHNRVPESISKSLVYLSKHRPTFLKLKKCKDAFSCLYRILISVQIRWRLWNSILGLFFFKTKILPQISLYFFKTTNKYFKTPNFFRRGATMMIGWLFWGSNIVVLWELVVVWLSVWSWF